VDVDIQEVLNRRSDLSTFVVHFTRDSGGQPAKANLESILGGLKIEARTAMGHLHGVPNEQRQESKVVCFTETPLEHAYSLVQDIAGRDIHLSSYGVAFTKEVARKKGANPIWYVDMTPGQDAQWAISKALDQIKDEALKSAGGFPASPIAKVLPFVEQMLTTESTQKEFWWEREWRHRGDFSFRQDEVALVFCPEAEISDIEEYGPPAVDPSWSLERMIDQLARSAVDVAMLRQGRRREFMKGNKS
jgi:hypothetical protein